MTDAPQCPYCGQEAALTHGAAIYPYRPDLHPLQFWLCAPCDAWVGCHKANARYELDGVEPLGRLANAELRAAKSAAHRAFDPLWKGGLFGSRREAYAWLAAQLDLHPEDCHIGMFDLDRCREVIRLCRGVMAEGDFG